MDTGARIYLWDMASSVLIVFAHPALEKSRVNRHLIQAVRDLPGVFFNDLYENYPDFQIDVRHEQELLRRHSTIIFMHPFYWYSAPALVKEWLDLVLEHGFAYGHNGTELQGKRMLNAVTAAGAQEAYRPEGYNHFTIRHLLSPFEQTANLCGMQYLAPFVVHRSLALSSTAEMMPYVKLYRTVVQGLVNETLDLAAAAKAERISDALFSETSFS
jgi:glutathione-regulated potassium-efflux system ancillary protein KefG